MGEFVRIAEGLAAVLQEKKIHGGIRPGEIADIIAGTMATGSGSMNCYPGIPGYACCDLSVFVSLNSPAYRKGRGHLSCRMAMEKIVQHMQGWCLNKTHYAVLITDNWDASAFDAWRGNLEQIKDHAHIEIYLLSGNSVSEMFI